MVNAFTPEAIQHTARVMAAMEEVEALDQELYEKSGYRLLPQQKRRLLEELMAELMAE